MIKRIISFSLIICIFIATNVFAFKWDYENGERYAVDDNVPIRLEHQLLSDNGYMYYTDDLGKPIIGWYVNPENHNVYFFDTNSGESAGSMVFGLKSVNDKLYYFNDNGSLARALDSDSYIKAFVEGDDDYWASYTGELYLNNRLIKVNKPDYTCEYNWYDNKEFTENSNEVFEPKAQ